MSIDFSSWTEATTNLNWGAQNVIHTALELAADGQVTIVYGADYYEGNACLVNTVGQMLEVGGGSGIPSQHFNDLVRNFDQLNGQLREQGVNTDYRNMSPLAAEILLQNFGELKPQPEITEPAEPTDKVILPGHREIIPEASDEDLAKSWLEAISTDAVAEDEVREVVDPVKELDQVEGPLYLDPSFSKYDA